LALDVLDFTSQRGRVRSGGKSRDCGFQFWIFPARFKP